LGHFYCVAQDPHLTRIPIRATPLDFALDSAALARHNFEHSKFTFCHPKISSGMSRLPMRASNQPVSLLLGSLAALLGLAGCETSDATTTAARKTYAGKYPIQVVCTTGMVADLAKNIGGEHVAVSALMGAGVDPHLYTASPADVSQLNRADIILYSGLHLEGKLADLLERMGRRKPTTAVAEWIAKGRIISDDTGAHDPHVWFDVSLWSQAAAAAADALAAFDPPHAETYRANLKAYQARLAELHTYSAEQIATVPVERRVLVTAHDAFQYFGKAYGIEVRGIQGISTTSEAGVRRVRELVDFLVERKIKAVFVETSVSDQNVRSLLEGCAARGHEIVIGGTLYSDAMGDEGTPEGAYEGMVRHNVDTIVKALK
jgi:manganese/zinc/iron transport system substrate-binding protein